MDGLKVAPHTHPSRSLCLGWKLQSLFVVLAGLFVKHLATLHNMIQVTQITYLSAFHGAIMQQLLVLCVVRAE
jgi:hypothetical protein